MLVSSQTAVKGEHGFEIAVRMDDLRRGDSGEIQNSAHRVRSIHSRSSLFSVVFMCLISSTQKFILEKSTINTKEWGKSRFDGILELWIFDHLYFGRFVAPAFCLIPRVRCFCFGAIMLDKETRRKDYWFLFFICLLVWFLYTAKCEFSSKLRVYIKDWSPSRGSGATVGLIFPEIFVSPLSEFEQHMYSSDPRPDTGSLMQLESRRAVPQASQPPSKASARTL